ncbi:MAG: phytanoyl-CoA dioxygenase family protein [Armatimonadota bacterium]
MALARTPRADLAERGYRVFPGLVTEPLRQRFLAKGAELVARGSALAEPDATFSLAPDANGQPLPGVLHKVQGVGVVDPAWLELASFPDLLAIVAELLGPSIDCFGTKFFPMDRAGASSTGWHTDNYYFGTDSERVLSCAIYLHDTDAGNGCLRVIPGSHREARPSHAPGSGSMAHGHWADVDEARAVDVVCPGGTVVLFSANLVHGARINDTGRPGFRTAWHYLPGDLHLTDFPRGVYRNRHRLAGD